MGRILAYSLILLALVSCGTGRKTAVTDSKEPASVQMRVGSYNLWRPGPRDDGYAWDVRKFRLAKTIAEIGFDVFGVQEFDTVIQNDLPGLVEKEGGNYEILYEDAKKAAIDAINSLGNTHYDSIEDL